VNLIGDHTDYTGGLVLPMAIDRWTTVTGTPTDDGLVHLTSDTEPEPAVVPVGIDDPAAVTPAWARYVAGVVAEVRPARGFRGTVSSTVPKGSGLSSSAALELAVALAVGAPGTPAEVARLCQAAEQRASGVPCGIMDQLTSAAGVDGHALLIDCYDLTVTPVPVPGDAEVVVVHSGQERALADSAYADRVAACAAAEREIGPLRLASPADTDRIGDPMVRRRARHVISENARVRAFAAALAADDLAEAGRLMLASHESLRGDYEVSTAVLDALVERLCAVPGVFGARLTGAGFGGCAVALTAPGALREGWVVRAVAGATVTR
jgi:galactokinase